MNMRYKAVHGCCPIAFMSPCTTPCTTCSSISFFVSLLFSFSFFLSFFISVVLSISFFAFRPSGLYHDFVVFPPFFVRDCTRERLGEWLALSIVIRVQFWGDPFYCIFAKFCIIGKDYR